MDIKFHRKRKDPLDNRYTIPVTTSMKSKIDSIKGSHQIDFNEMLRQFLERAIEKVESGEIKSA